MIAFVTTLGEPTTDLCIWSLKRNGFEVHTVSGSDSLASKLKRIYKEAYYLDVDFIRVDADVVPNKNLTPENIKSLKTDADWWIQFMVYDWFKQNCSYGGVQYIRKEALTALNSNIGNHLEAERPETEMYRLPEFDNPRRCISIDVVMGLHGYKNDASRVKETKKRRGQLDNYDFELAERLNLL